MIRLDNIPDKEVRNWYENKKKEESDGKFNSIVSLKNVERSRKPQIVEVDSSEKISLCVVYSLWTNRKYLRLLYTSILSQYKFTDVHYAHVKVFTDKHLFNETKSMLSGFPIEVIQVNEKFRKYATINHSSLDEFKTIVVCDCDTFFYSQANKPSIERQQFIDHRANVYRRLEQENRIFMLEDPDQSFKVFYSRMELSPYTVASDYIRWFEVHNCPEVVENILERPRWFLSCFMSFPKHIFAGKEWLKYCEDALKMSYNGRDLPHGCDETIFLTYAWKKNHIIEDITALGMKMRAVYAAYVGDYLDNLEFTEKDLYILHPLHGSFCIRYEVQSIYEKILE